MTSRPAAECIVDALVVGYREMPREGDDAADFAYLVSALPRVVEGDLAPLLACAIIRLADREGT